ncbi:MAG: large-conductance mechanosensitive channel protein MscL [Caulobacter sp.]|nr:large-conductance mechanosensitive channel protein MscL [Caulobacter sp.]
MSVVSEFRQFISRGNVIDLAVGVIIGAAFGKIVTVLVDGVIMPPIGLILGKVDFSDLKIVLAPEDAASKTAEVAIAYGAFINTVIQFVIVAIAVFLLVKLVNAARRKEAEAPAPSAPPAPTPSEALLTEIRDLLAAQRTAPAAEGVPAAEAAVVRKPAVRKPAAPKKT